VRAGHTDTVKESKKFKKAKSWDLVAKKAKSWGRPKQALSGLNCQK